MSARFSLERQRGIGIRALAGASALLVATIVIAALALGGGKLIAIPLALGLLVLPGLTVWRDAQDQAARLTVAITPPVLTALLVFVAEGRPWQVDLHMIFFATLAMVVILCDWRAIVATTAVVAVHHLLFGMLVPDWVFLGGGSLLRILLHAVILLSETAVLVWTCHRIVEMLDSIARENAERQAVEARAAAEREARAEGQKLLLETLGTQLKALSDGNLAAEITTDFPPAYAQLKDDYNRAVASLRGLIASVGASARSIRTGSAEIGAATDDMARRAERTSASLQGSAATVEEINARLRSTAAAAGRTLGNANDTIATVADGRGVAEGAVAAMARVADSAEGIDDVIEGLDKIAFQTRVLAMNAAVEAGRAGEAGRGFAVVADLVSALAMRAEEEAKRAREQLTTTQAEIGGAVRSVQQVDAALEAIATQAGQVHALLGEIAADNAAQSDAIAAVSATLTDIDRATQQDAAMVEETSAAVHTLLGEVEALATNAARFRTEAAAGAAPRAAPARAPARPARAAAMA